jgi:hypothetical protein
MAQPQPKRLRAVTPSDKPASKQSVAQAAESGDRRSLLVAMRDRIAQTVANPECPPRDLAALTRRLQDIAKDIEAIDLRAKQEGADANDVAADEDWDASAL